MTNLAGPNGEDLTPINEVYKAVTAGITVSTQDLLGRPVETELEAEILRYLINNFIGSEDLYKELKTYIQTNFDTAYNEVKAAALD